MTSTNSDPSEPSLSMAASDGALLKMDTQGRVRTSKARRREVLEEFEKCGVSAAQFARVTGLKYTTLAGWLQRERRAKSKSSKSPEAGSGLRLVEAVVGQEERPGGSPVLVHLPGEVRLEVTCLGQVPLVAALAQALQPAAARC